VILTVPWHAIGETLTQLGDLSGTVVVDVSYPHEKSEREALKGPRPPRKSKSGCRAPECSGLGIMFSDAVIPRRIQRLASAKLYS
jgi:hypothetical protein